MKILEVIFAVRKEIFANFRREGILEKQKSQPLFLKVSEVEKIFLISYFINIAVKN